MDENLHNIDDLFRKALDEHEEMPSSSVWDNIDQGLDKKRVISISRKYNKLKWAAAALLIFSAGMAMYTVHTKIKEKELAKTNSLRLKTTANREGLKPSITPGKPDSAIVTKEQPITVEKGQAKNSSQSDTTTAEAPIPPSSSKDALASNLEGRSHQERRVTKVKTIAKKLQSNSSADKQLDEALVARAENKNSAVHLPTTVKIKESTVAKSDWYDSKKRVEDATIVVRSREDLLNLQTNNGLLEKVFSGAATVNAVEDAVVASSASKIKGYKRNMVSASLIVSPDLVSAKVDNGHGRFREDDRNEIKNKEEIRKASSFGLLLDYHTGGKLSIESGIVFSSFTTYIQPKTIFARPDSRGNINYRFNCSAGYSFLDVHTGNPLVAGDSVTAIASTNTLHYITVPLGIKYQLLAGKFNVSAGVGIAGNFLTKAKIETKIPAATGDKVASIDHIEGLNKSYYNGSLSVTAAYDINKTFAINLSPLSRFALSPINSDAPVKTYINSFGLQAGLTIKL